MATSDLRRTLKIIIITLLALVIIGYSIYQARNIITGPKIVIISPQNGSVINDPLVEIKGVAKNSVDLTLDGRTIFTDENGAFSEHILLDSGYTVHKVTAKDKFGRSVETLLELIFSGNRTDDTSTSSVDH